jgi:branched-chain amino acid transport system permease protein
VTQQEVIDLATRRDHPLMLYYLALSLEPFAFVLSAWLLRSRAGFYFRAIRDGEDAARAAGVDTFRYKLFAIQISAALTSLAGVFFAFYYNNLFPEQIFNMGRSIEIILAPIIGGIGTLFGPVLGAAILTLLSEGLTEALAALGWEVPGIKQIFYGIALAVAIMFMPHGVWPALARRFGFARIRDDS